MKSAGPARMVSTLAVACFLSGLLLVAVFRTTHPIIVRNQAQALEEAIYRVLPGATSKRAFVEKEGRLVEIPAERQTDEAGPFVFAGMDDQGTLVGFAIPAEGPGFQDTIGLIFGYQPNTGNIIGMEVLQSRETPGLGDKIAKDAAFRGQFTALATSPQVAAVKGGTATAPNQVDAISGATISSKAVVSILNQAVKRWQTLIDESQRIEERKPSS